MDAGQPAGPREPATAPRKPRRREIASYCLFDFGNSAYTTLIITVVFSVYFREVVVDAPGNAGDRLWGITHTSSMTLVALLSPILGALADFSGRRKFFLVFTTLQTVIACALLFFVGPGDVVWAMVLYIIGTVGFEGGYIRSVLVIGVSESEANRRFFETEVARTGAKPRNRNRRGTRTSGEETGGNHSPPFRTEGHQN